MKLIENQDSKKYEQFVFNHSKSHFLQSYIWGQFEKENANRIPHYLTLEDENGNIEAAALLLEKKLPLGYCYFYAPRGYIIDYQNKELLEVFTKELNQYGKKKKAIFIKIDPDIPLQKLDVEGNVMEKENNNFQLVEFLKSIHYTHLGFNKNFEHSQPRYTFRLDLTQDIESLQNHFHPTTKKILKKGNPYEFILEKNEDAKIEDFYLTMMETAKREGVLYHDISYYKNFYETLHKENMSDLYVVKANIPRIREIYQEKITILKENIKKLEQKEDNKNKNKKQEFINQLEKAEKEKRELDNIKEETLILSSILTVKYHDKVWTVHGGNHSLLRELNANYYIYYQIILDAKIEGYQTIDFFGTTGDPKKENPIYGIHLFKKRLGGEYTEFIGEFDFVIRKSFYFFFTKLIPIYRKVKRNLLQRKKD